MVAADSLVAVASQLQSAQAALGDRLVNRSDLSPHHTPDIFFQTVKVSSFTLADMPVLLPGARLFHFDDVTSSQIDTERCRFQGPLETASSLFVTPLVIQGNHHAQHV